MNLSRKNIAWIALGCLTAVQISAFLLITSNEEVIPLPSGSRFPSSTVHDLETTAVPTDSILTGNGCKALNSYDDEAALA